MPLWPTTYNWDSVLILLVLVLASLSILYRKILPLPPCPPQKLLSGNIHQFPKAEPWKTYASWASRYGIGKPIVLAVWTTLTVPLIGPIIHLRAFTKHIIILNTAKAALDLLESRSPSIYSDRPIVWMYKELVGRKLAVFNISSRHARFRKYRTLLRSALGTKDAFARYRAIQDRDSVEFVRLLQREPEKFVAHARRIAGSTILEFAYGWSVQSEDDYLVSLMHESFQLQAEIVKPGRWLVDTFPLFRFIPSWFPGGGFHNKAEEYHKKMDPIDKFPHSWAKEQLASGQYLPSFTSMQLESERDTIDGGLSEEQEDIIRWCSSALYAGGADTTVSVMTTFFLMMVLYPGVQKRAQEEINNVIGQERLPSLDDRKKLPYVNALAMRWGPPAPLGLPHRVTREDEYMGYRIPEGATVYANIWAITHDPDLYEDSLAETFDPTRYLRETKFVFGFGRRVCPGAQFAEDSLFYNIARILSTRKVVDDSGNEVEPKVEFTSTVTSHVKPFSCRIILRESSAGAKVLNSTAV